MSVEEFLPENWRTVPYYYAVEVTMDGTTWLSTGGYQDGFGALREKERLGYDPTIKGVRLRTVIDDVMKVNAGEGEGTPYVDEAGELLFLNRNEDRVPIELSRGEYRNHPNWVVFTWFYRVDLHPKVVHGLRAVWRARNEARRLACSMLHQFLYRRRDQDEETAEMDKDLDAVLYASWWEAPRWAKATTEAKPGPEQGGKTG